MITGASQADAVTLVVFAKEGIQDQTKQHLFLIKTLGINQLIIALNKMDEVNYDKGRYKEISEKLKKILPTTTKAFNLTKTITPNHYQQPQYQN